VCFLFTKVRLAELLQARYTYIYIYIYYRNHNKTSRGKWRVPKRKRNERWNLTHIFVSNIWHKQTTAETEKLPDKLLRYIFARAALKVTYAIEKLPGVAFRVCFFY